MVDLSAIMLYLIFIDYHQPLFSLLTRFTFDGHTDSQGTFRRWSFFGSSTTVSKGIKALTITGFQLRGCTPWWGPDEKTLKDHCRPQTAQVVTTPNHGVHWVCSVPHWLFDPIRSCWVHTEPQMVKALQEGKTMKTNVDKRLFSSKNRNIIYDGKQTNPYKLNGWSKTSHLEKPFALKNVFIRPQERTEKVQSYQNSDIYIGYVIYINYPSILFPLF